MGEVALQISNSLEWVRPPKQARSQRTLERLLDATEFLIAEGGVESITISAVVRRAKSSVGAFYARFPDKESLLRCVVERFYEEASATNQVVLEPKRWDGVPLRHVLQSALRFVTQVTVERRGIIAAIATRPAAETGPESLALALLDDVASGLLALIKHRGLATIATDPERAVRTLVWMVLSSLSAWALAGANQEAPPSDPEQFAADVSAMCLGFLFADTDV